MEDWELFLVDDQSTDNTSEIMSLYEGGERISTMRTDGIGLPAVANTVLKKARGKYVIRLDGDDVFDENILLVLCHHLETHPDVALVFPDYYLVDEHMGLIRQEWRTQIFQSNHVVDIPPNGACTLIRRSILDQIGRYREDLRAQDGFDIWTKIFNDFRCANINLPLFYYRRHGKNLTDNVVRILEARRTIKRDGVEKLLPAFKPVLSVIPCRRNYDIFPNLWSKCLNGDTLLDIAIRTSCASRLFDAIVVVSDNAEVEKVVARHDDPRLTVKPRDPRSTIPSVDIAETLEPVVREMAEQWEGITVLSYVQAPFATTSNLEEAAYSLLLNDADSAFGVEEIEASLFRRDANGLVAINKSGKFRSDYDVIYSDARTSLAIRNHNLKHGSLMGSRVVNFVVPKREAFFIHSREEFEVARIMKERT